MRALLAFLLITTAVAGCLDDRPMAAQDPEAEARSLYVDPVQFIDDGHDHGDPLTHDVANNITQVGFHPLGDGGPPGSVSEIDVAGDHAFVGVMGHGFMIVDIEDPTDPQLVSSVEVTTPDHQLPTDVYLADLKVDRTGDWVFVALELSTTPGVLIYDARDKANPTLAGFWPEPGLLLGCHMIEYAIIGEQEYLFCAPLDNAVYVGLILPPVDTPAGSVREIVQVARWMPHTPKFAQQQVAALEAYVSQCSPDDPTCLAAAATHFVSGHQDMTWQKDPLDGRDVLSVSFWNLGLRFVDVSNPALPLEIGSWAGESAGKWDGVLHTSMMFPAVRDGQEKRIAVTIPEGARPPALFVLDATDYNDPILLAEWTAVDDFRGEDGRYSMHNFQVVDGKIYLAMYHGGIWVFDVSTPDYQDAPKVLGNYNPWDRETGNGCCGGSWDVVVWRGHMIAGNTGGLYVLKFDGDPDADEHSGFA